MLTNNGKAVKPLMSEKFLILDTSTEACSAALWLDGVLSQRFEVSPRGHSKLILPMVESLLADANLSLADLDAIAYGRGPGSFTGVRIGSGIMQGLALGGDKPVLPVSTLAAMAQQAIDDTGADQVLAAIDARMGEVYWGQYRNVDGLAVLVDKEMVVAPEALASIAFNGDDYVAVGTAWATYPAMTKLAAIKVNEDILYPAAAAMAPLATALWRDGGAMDVADAQPVYLRDKVTWKKLPGRE